MKTSRICAAGALLICNSAAFAGSGQGGQIAVTTIILGLLLLVPYQALCQLISIKVFESSAWAAGEPPLASKVLWIARTLVAAAVITAFMRDGRHLGPANWVETFGGAALVSLVFMAGCALFFPSSQGRRWAHNFSSSMVGLSIMATSVSWLLPRPQNLDAQHRPAAISQQGWNDGSITSAQQSNGPWVKYQPEPGGEPFAKETPQEVLQRYADGVIKQYPFLDRPEYTKVVSLIVAERDRLMAQGVAAPQALQRAADAIAPQFDPGRKN